MKSLPDELCALPQWVLWRYEQKPDKAKPDKVPYTCMGYKASVTNPDQWSSYGYALQMACRPGFAEGLGFVFSAADPYCGVDLDNCYPSDAAECAPWAKRLLERFGDCYSEASPSDAGVKIWCRARSPRCGKWTVEAGAVEVYDNSRFFTVTGRHAGILTIADHQQDIEALVTNLDEDRYVAHQSHTIPDVIPQGQRHPTLVSLAGTMFRRGMTLEAIEAALLITDEKQCDPPHGPEHIHKIVASMARWQR